MSRRIVRPSIVKLDLAELADFIARGSPNAGLRFLDAAQQEFQKLSEMPNLGGVWESTNPKLSGIWVWQIGGFEKYLIFYKPIRDGISIVRVLHGARDVENVLGANQ